MSKVVCLLLLLSSIANAANYLLHTPQQATAIHMQSWMHLRDQGIEKQDLDYSCGSAAVATILRSYYGIEVYEKDILKEVESLGNDGAASFTDLKHTVQTFGFKATGISTDFETLRTIKIPALLYLKYRDKDHFSVLRGISKSHVLLADPAWGNRTFTIHQFRKLWEQNKFKGKVLVIVPNGEAIQNTNFFQPQEVNTLPVDSLSFR